VSDFFVVVTLAKRDRLQRLTNIPTGRRSPRYPPATNLIVPSRQLGAEAQLSKSHVLVGLAFTVEAPLVTGHRRSAEQLVVRSQTAEPIGDFLAPFTGQSADFTSSQSDVPSPLVVCRGRLSILKRTGVRFPKSCRPDRLLDSAFSPS